MVQLTLNDIIGGWSRNSISPNHLCLNPTIRSIDRWSGAGLFHQIISLNEEAEYPDISDFLKCVSDTSNPFSWVLFTPPSRWSGSDSSANNNIRGPDRKERSVPPAFPFHEKHPPDSAPFNNSRGVRFGLNHRYDIRSPPWLMLAGGRVVPRLPLTPNSIRSRCINAIPHTGDSQIGLNSIKGSIQIPYPYMGIYVSLHLDRYRYNASPLP